MAARYWCHMCSQIVNPLMEVETEIKCPICHSGFVEEMGNSTRDNSDPNSDFGSERALSLWAPILLGMMGNPHRPGRFRRHLESGGNENNYYYNEDGASLHGGETVSDRELESVARRRRRSSAMILHLLQGIRAGIELENENSENDRDRERERGRERERVILINPFNQTIIFRGSSNDPTQGHNLIGSLGDYFIGPGLDMLLQHLAENDPSRYGTPPAKKEAVEGMPTVKIEDNLQCSVCLDDIDSGAEAREMPCKHKFHSECIVHWLELHSSCPICRFQLPADESKRECGGSQSRYNRRQIENGNGEEGHGAGDGDDDGDGRTGTARRISIPWPFTSLFPSSGSQSAARNLLSMSATSSSGTSSGNETLSGNDSHEDEN